MRKERGDAVRGSQCSVGQNEAFGARAECVSNKARNKEKRAKRDVMCDVGVTTDVMND